MNARLIPLVAAATALLLAACGDGGNAAAGSDTKPKTLEEALGMSDKDMRERERKVQAAIQACMKEQGFDYVPLDPDAGNLQIAIGGPGVSGPDKEFRRTKGYGITTTFGERPSGHGERTDPNQRIREALSESDRKAYDTALFGNAAIDEGPGGGRMIVIGPGGGVAGKGNGDGNDDEDGGCFATAQREVGGRSPATIGPKLQELEERIQSDPRLVRVDAAWAACMTSAGFGQFEKPEKIVDYLIGELQKLTDQPGAGGISTGSPDVDEVALGRLQREELALAAADDNCTRQTAREKVVKKVRAEHEERFLAENPNLTAGK